MNNLLKTVIVLFCAVTTLFGCASRKSFTLAARPGDTVVLGVGWYPEVERNDLTITITDALGGQTTYSPGDPAVRAVVNLYPDPVSKLIVDSQLGVNPVAQDANILQLAVTGGNKEYSEKFIMIDLPFTMTSTGQPMSTGQANIDITSATGDTINPLKVEILPGAGESNPLGNYNGWSIDSSHLQYMERSPYYRVDFTGTTIPYAIQIDLLRNQGVGEAFVTNARADLKGITWFDDGLGRLRVILMPSGAGLDDMQHFRFYVAGGLTGLSVDSVSAFDADGGAVNGVSASITANP